MRTVTSAYASEVIPVVVQRTVAPVAVTTTTSFATAPACREADRLAADASDEELLTALQRHDVRALEYLYDRYGRMAFGLAYRLLQDAGQAEDVVQEALIKVWRQAPTFDVRRGSARAWLLSIVHHRAIDWLRSRAHRHDLQLDQVEHSLSQPDDWGVVERNIDRELVQQALTALPNEQRQTVVMAYFEGLSQPEIALAMGVPLSTVKGRMRMAIQKLRGLLAGIGEVAPALSTGQAA